MNGSKQGNGVTAHWVGLDVSKPFFDAGLLLDGTLGEAPAPGGLPGKRFARTRAGAADFVAWLDEHGEAAGVAEDKVRCVMETTGRYSLELAIWLIELRPSLAPAVVHAKHTSDFIKSLGVRNQTDALAAQALAIFGFHRQPKAFEPASKKERELRDLSRYRHTLVAHQTDLKNQIQEGAENAFVRRDQAKRLRHVQRDIERTEREMKTLIDKLPAVKEDVALLQTIYGVGFITAAVVRAELGDLSRFDKARQLSAYVGLNPCIRRSGTSVRYKTRMSKQGNKRARQALYMAAKTAIRGDNDFARDYRRALASGLAPKAALGVVMRKILVVMRRLIIYRETYNPKHKHGGKPCGKAAVKTILEQTAEAMTP